MANPIRFQPLDGIPDADERGAGTFHFDDGTSIVGEDPELASLVKSYQADIPELQNIQAGLDSVPDQRMASNDPIGSVFGEDPFGDNKPSEATDAGGAQAADFLGNAEEYTPKARGYIPETNAAYRAAPAAEPAPVTGGAPMPATPPPNTDAQNAAELHRLAAEQALRGGYVQGHAAGYTPAQRSGALDPEVAKRQTEQRGASNQELVDTTIQARQSQADLLRQSALQEAMRLTVQRADQERAQREAEAKRQRLLDERRKVNDAQIDTSFAQGDSFRQVMAVMGAALLGAVGSDTGLRMIESNIDRHVRKEMQVRGSKLQALAEEIGSEEQVVNAAKARIYELMEKQAGATQKTLRAADIENQTPAVIAELKRRALDSDQAFERESLGKTTEVYRQAQAGGRTGPDLKGAAAQYEAAAKAGQAAKPEKAQVDASKALAKVRRIRDTLVRGRQSGSVYKVTGWQDKIGANGIQKFFGGLPKDQQEQAMALDSLRVENLGSTAREFNSQRAQGMLEQLGVPTNDSEVDLAIDRLNQVIRDEEEAQRTGYTRAAPQPVEVR